MEKAIKDCVLRSLCCDGKAIQPVAWYGEMTKYKCLGCGCYWEVRTNLMGRLSDKSGRNIREFDLDVRIKNLKEAKEELKKDD